MEKSMCFKKILLLCRRVVFFPLSSSSKKSLVCQKDEARREMSLWWLRIIVLKALFKLLLTKLKHLACGACVPTFSLNGMHEDGRLPGWKEGRQSLLWSAWLLWLLWPLSALCLLNGAEAEEENHLLEHVFMLQTICQVEYICAYLSRLMMCRESGFGLKRSWAGGKGKEGCVYPTHILCQAFSYPLLGSVLTTTPKGRCFYPFIPGKKAG